MQFIHVYFGYYRVLGLIYCQRIWTQIHHKRKIYKSKEKVNTQCYLKKRKKKKKICRKK